MPNYFSFEKHHTRVLSKTANIIRNHFNLAAMIEHHESSGINSISNFGSSLPTAIMFALLQKGRPTVRCRPETVTLLARSAPQVWTQDQAQHRDFTSADLKKIKNLKPAGRNSLACYLHTRRRQPCEGERVRIE
jgi:hypothetical protein